jgi:hypothetical protein
VQPTKPAASQNRLAWRPVQKRMQTEPKLPIQKEPVEFSSRSNSTLRMINGVP